MNSKPPFILLLALAALLFSQLGVGCQKKETESDPVPATESIPDEKAGREADETAAHLTEIPEPEPQPEPEPEPTPEPPPQISLENPILEPTASFEVLSENNLNATVAPGGMASVRWDQNLSLTEEWALSFSVEIDPILSDEGSRSDIDAGIVLGMPTAASNPNRFAEPGDKVFLEFKEFADRTRFTIVIDGQEISFWNRLRMTGGKGLPNVGTRQPGETYLLKIVAIPRGEQTGLRFFVEHGDRPLRLFKYDDPNARDNIHGEFVTEWTLDRPLTENNFLGLYVREGRKASGSTTTRFENLSARYIPIEEAEHWMDSEEFVMANINYDHPAIADVKAAREAGDMELAEELLVDYFRTRELPVGPEYDREMARATVHGKEANWREVSDNAIDGIYSKLSWFHGFSAPGELSRENGLPLWGEDPGFLNRHFHWVVMAHAWLTTGQAKYAARVGDELIDWVTLEPHFDWETEGLGGMASMDGTVISEHVLWTGNIGRRLEMTWWQMFEVFRKAEDFSDEAVFAFLDGVIRQCRLLTNPSVFLEWDDSGLHGAMALAKSGLLFNVADEAELWSTVGWDRINTVMDEQFQPDGSHVSLSTGYEWATIGGFEKFYKYVTKNGGEVPDKMHDVIESMYSHPFAITRPNFGSVDLNDGVWRTFTGEAQNAFAMFPEREDYEFFATEGASGEAPDPVSMYFPNAGQFIMRTGWGADEGHQYLFFGASPIGASHGKQDALNIYTHYGKQLLVRNAGRGAYSGVGNTVHAGQSLSFNVPSPDWGQQNSLPHVAAEKAINNNPPNRRWVSDEDFDYGEGTYTYGWHKPGEHIQGNWLRQVVFVKGENPKTDGYYIVVDTVEPKTDRERTWRHPWQLDTQNIKLLDDGSMAASTPHAALQILPVDPAGDMSVEIIKGQVEPQRLGWRINHETANPWAVPTYAWKADGTFSRAWVIQMQDTATNWPVASVQAVPTKTPGELMFKVNRRDGGADYVIRRSPGSEATTFNREEVTGDLVIISRDASGAITARLEMEGGLDSIAKATETQIAKAQPNTSERLGRSDSQRINSNSNIRLENPSFESPTLQVESGAFDGWTSNSLRGTGTWPVARAGAEGEADGSQVAVIHAGGFIGQTLKDASGKPLAITPGAKIRVTFRNLPIEDPSMRPINMGVYLMAGEKDGARIATAFPFKEDANTPGVKTVDFTISDKATFDNTLPAGWETIPVYLQFWTFGGRTVIDDVQVEVL